MENTEEFLLIQNKMPHVATNIKMFWGTSYFNDYINRIMLDTRDGERSGFPSGVAKAIHILQAKHDEEFPQPTKQNDIWESGYHRW